MVGKLCGIFTWICPTPLKLIADLEENILCSQCGALVPVLEEPEEQILLTNKYIFLFYPVVCGLPED